MYPLSFISFDATKRGQLHIFIQMYTLNVETVSEYKLQSQLIQDFFTAICILLSNFTVLLGNFKIQMMI